MRAGLANPRGFGSSVFVRVLWDDFVVSILQCLKPTAVQGAGMLQHCQDTRFVWNIGLEQRSMWSQTRRFYAQKINFATQSRELAELRAELDWVGEGSSAVQQGALRDLDTAFTNFFEKRADYPAFKKRDSRAGSFVVRDLKVRRVNHRWGETLIPKVGWVRFRPSKTWTEIEAATSARVKLRHGRWTVSFTTPARDKINPGTGAMIGIDRGVANTIATSDADMFQAPTLTTGEKKRFLALEQRVSRQRKGSARREKTIKDLGKLRLRLDDRRTDWIEQTTTLLARQYDVVALEKLNTVGMTKRVAPKPDPENEGFYLPNGRAAKSGLNRAILASCWGKFAQRLEHKTNVKYVNPQNTSRECFECHHISADNRKSQAVFECQKCGHEAHADTNAAKIILGRATTAPKEQERNPRTAGVRTCKSRKSHVNHLAA